MTTLVPFPGKDTPWKERLVMDLIAKRDAYLLVESTDEMFKRYEEIKKFADKVITRFPAGKKDSIPYDRYTLWNVLAIGTIIDYDLPLFDFEGNYSVVRFITSLKRRQKKNPSRARTA